MTKAKQLELVEPKIQIYDNLDAFYFVKNLSDDSVQVAVPNPPVRAGTSPSLTFYEFWHGEDNLEE
jgi:hypothetical protein